MLIHPSGLIARIVEKTVARRGRLHMFETLDPQRTALVIIDLNADSVAGDENCIAMVPRINALASALRRAGGRVDWIVPRALDEPSPSMIATFGAERAAAFVAASQVENPRDAIDPRLGVKAEDQVFTKSGPSAFFPDRCDLPAALAAAGIRSVLIAGTVTNVCCESSARDAVQHGYEVTMVSDACAGHAFGLHEASLNTFYRTFGDVRPVADVIGLIGSA